MLGVDSDTQFFLGRVLCDESTFCTFSLNLAESIYFIFHLCICFINWVVDLLLCGDLFIWNYVNFFLHIYAHVEEYVDHFLLFFLTYQSNQSKPL